MQVTQNSQNNIKKGQGLKNHNSQFQILLQSFSNQKCIALTQDRHKPIKPN